MNRGIYLVYFGVLIVALSNTGEASLLGKLLGKPDFRRCVDESCEVNDPVKNETCIACELALSVARKLVIENRTQEIESVVQLLCIQLKIEDNVVCTQVINTYIFSATTVALTTTLTDRDLCASILNCAQVDNPLINWNITLPNYPKPPVVPPVPPKPGSPTIRILHLTDIHIDFEYQPGSLAECNQPLCCRNSSTPKYGQTVDAAKLAAYWGDNRLCDIPVWTVQNMFEHIAKNEQFDFIYWTGDLPPHNVWNQSRSDQLSALKILTTLFQTYFPNKLIYPSLGNHEAAPCNLFPTPVIQDDNITWLYNALAVEWTKTGLPQSLQMNITRGAFYTLLIKPGLRLISLNMNYCPSLNFWLFVNSTDPLNQLSWLASILQQSELAGEKVHIIGHINPGGCMSSWSSNYYRIVNRYESTIVGQFFGHTHKDELEIFYDLQTPTRPVGVAYISGSVTTRQNLNPSYRIYTIDGQYANSSWQVLDHENYFLNLTEANLDNNPVWRKEYSAKDAYNMKSLYPADWDNLVNKMLSDLKGPLANLAYKYYTKSYDGRKACDAECLHKILCKFKQARPGNLINC